MTSRSADVVAGIERSATAFRTLVWPKIGDGFGEVIPVESVSDNIFADELDRRAGVDVWLLTGARIRGLASRVQWTDDPYRTFTIRAHVASGRPTELDKRRAELRAIRSGDAVVTVQYIAQAYISRDRSTLLAAAIARMSDVIDAIDRGSYPLRSNRRDQTQFYAVPWADLDADHVRVWP